MSVSTAPATVSTTYLHAHPEGTDVRAWSVYADYFAAVSHSLKGANAAARREIFAAWTADAAALAARWDVDNIQEPSNRGVWASAVALSQVLRDLAPGRKGEPFKWAADVLALLPALDAEPTPDAHAAHVAAHVADRYAPTVEVADVVDFEHIDGNGNVNSVSVYRLRDGWGVVDPHAGNIIVSADFEQVRNEDADTYRRPEFWLDRLAVAFARRAADNLTDPDEDADAGNATPADYARELNRAGYIAGWTYARDGVELVAFNGETMEVTPESREDMQDMAIWADSNHVGGWARTARAEWLRDLVEGGTLSPAALEMEPWRVADQHNDAHALAPNDPDYILPPSLHRGEFGQWMTEDTRTVYREVTSNPADVGALRAMSRAELAEWTAFVAECIDIDPADVCHAQVWGEVHNG